MSGVKYPDIVVPLLGEDSNAFAVLGRVTKAIRRAKGVEASSAFLAEATKQTSYEALMGVVMATVEVA